MQSSKNKSTSFTNNSFLEQLKGFSSQAGKSVKNDLLKGGLRTAWNQFSGGGIENESFEKENPPEKVERKEVRSHAAYETRQEIILFSARERETMREIETIRVEMQEVIKKVDQVDFAIEKAVMEIPVKPGVYHVRFLERIRKLLKLIREKLEDSLTWLKVSQSKRKQRGYWQMYKKRGTSFGLSNERVLSTQTG